MRNLPTHFHEAYTYSGVPYETGLERGKKYADLIKKSVARQVAGHRYDSSSWLAPEQYNLEWFKEHRPSDYKDYMKWVESTPEWLREEIRGLADGSGVPYEKLMIHPKHLPFIVKTREGEKGNSEPSLESGVECLSFTAFGDATKGGKVISGGNGEGSGLGPNCCIKRWKNKSMNNVVMFSSEPWSANGQWGINDKGLSWGGNAIACLPEAVGEVGYDLMWMRIILQECDNIDEVLDLLKDNRFIHGHHWYFADKKGAVHVDVNARDYMIDDSTSEFNSGASPVYTNPKFRKWNDVLYDETDPDYSYRRAAKRGIFRMERFHELYEEKKPLSMSDIPSILGDHGGRGSLIARQEIDGAPPQGSDYTICVHGKRIIDKGQDPTGTIGRFHAIACGHIEEHDNPKMYISWGSPCECGFVPYTPPK